MTYIRLPAAEHVGYVVIAADRFIMAYDSQTTEGHSHVYLAGLPEFKPYVAVAMTAQKVLETLSPRSGANYWAPPKAPPER